MVKGIKRIIVNIYHNCVFFWWRIFWSIFATYSPCEQNLEDWGWQNGGKCIPTVMGYSYTYKVVTHKTKQTKTSWKNNPWKHNFSHRYICWMQHSRDEKLEVIVLFAIWLSLVVVCSRTLSCAVRLQKVEIGKKLKSAKAEADKNGSHV